MKGYDPRTHLAILLLASLLSLLTGGDWQSHLLLLLSGVYLLLNRLMKKALLYGGVYILLRLLFVVSLANGLATLASLIYAFFKMIPMVMIGAALVDTSPSALLCAYQKMHAPQGVLVMLCILVRFFPVVFQEMQAIRDGIRARAFSPAGTAYGCIR
ncbi:MAG: energy-coupling factor transporter transmembrane component T [Bacillota bacterium]|jgi:energy-coupling factor transport system permease protein